MKNLKLLWNIVNSFSSVKNSEQFTVETIGTSKWDNLFSIKNGAITLISQIKRECKIICSWNDLCENEKKLEVVSMFYSPITSSLYIAVTRGDVFILDFEIVPLQIVTTGIIEGGLQVMEWSPDMETIVFITKDNTVILMSNNFELLMEINMLDDDAAEEKMVNVGWGSEETQFHGSLGKQAAKMNLETPIQENTSDDRKSRVTWKDDSSLFAVSYFCENLQIRKIKIYKSNGNLHCVAETLNGLNEPIAWRPSGHLIALTQTFPNKYVVCFIEKNGLRHGEFTLPSDIKVKELSWNCESTILCTLSVDMKTQKDCVLLWTCSNYYWSLKQRLDFKSSVVALYWDQLVGNRIYILLIDGRCLTYQWTWVVDHSYGVGNNDWSNVAVIDGCDVKLTPFKKTMIPPPMCKTKITLPSSALQIMFAHCTSKQSPDPKSLGDNPNNLCVFMSDGRLAFVSQSEGGAVVESIVSIKWPSSDIECTTPLALSHWAWLTPELFLCIISSDNGQVYLCELQLCQDELVVIQTTELHNLVLSVSSISGESGYAIIQLETGELLKYSSNNSLTSWNFSLPEPCAKLLADSENVYALSERYRLYVNSSEVANNVTSFLYYPPFLIISLTQHVLRVLKIKSIYKSEDDMNVSGRVERGSKIVVAIGDSVVLQVPQGYLTTIQPRALILVTAAKMLDNCDYKLLAQLLRRQRINLNLCVDHNPTLFLLSVTRFVQQIHDPLWISVFLSELDEKDVTRTLYTVHYDQSTRPPPLPNKVERICIALRSAMSQSEADREYYINPILISYIKTGEIVQALNLANTDKALQYLILLMDTEKLYEEALGAYNLEKALKIAAKTQNDPKEYVMYLNELRQMDPNYMKYTIDKRLQKYNSALTHLALCQGDAMFEECLVFMKEHALYALSLQLFQGQPERYKTIALLYGEFLMTKHKYDEAGLIFLRSEHLNKAIEAYIKAGDWRQCVVLARECRYSDSEVKQLYKSLLDVLKSHQAFKDASELCRELLLNIDGAVTCLVEGRFWSEAIYLSQTNQRTDLIEKVVIPGVQETASTLLSEMKTLRDVLEKHSSRLVQLRQDKLSRADNPNFDAMSDIQSETGSVSSFNTSSTSNSRSTKNTRKMQRKMWSLKEGNPREEQALLSEIYQSILAIYKLTDEIRSTCTILVRFNLDEKANALQLSMVSTLTLAEKIKFCVWPIKNQNQQHEENVAQMDAQLNFPPTNCSIPSWQMNMFTI